MTTNDLQSLIDDAARSIAAFNDSEYDWQDCLEEPAHHKGRYCEHQVVALANHLVANKHPVQGIEAAKLTPGEMLAIITSEVGGDRFRMIADAATAKALRVQDARHKALVEALRNYVNHDDWLSSEINERRLLSNLANWYHQAQAALKMEEEAS